MTILDEAIADIYSGVAQYPPERGGLLFGPRGCNLISLFVLDSDGRTSPTTYAPSQRIRKLVKRIERVTGLEFKGVLHSHPGCLDRPSPGDQNAAKTALRLNLHLGDFLMPIVSVKADTSALAEHQLDIGHAIISAYRAFRRRSKKDGPCRLRTAPIRVIGIREDLRRCTKIIESQWPSVQLELADRGSSLFEGETFRFGYPMVVGGRGFAVIVGNDYPFFPAKLLGPSADGEIPLPWQTSGDPAQMLADAIMASFGEHDFLPQEQLTLNIL